MKRTTAAVVLAAMVWVVIVGWALMLNRRVTAAAAGDYNAARTALPQGWTTTMAQDAIKEWEADMAGVPVPPPEDPRKDVICCTTNGDDQLACKEFEGVQVCPPSWWQTPCPCPLDPLWEPGGVVPFFGG